MNDHIEHDDIDDDPNRRTMAWHDGYQDYGERLEEAENPYLARCTYDGDEEACDAADEWEAGAAACRAEIEERHYR